MKLTGKLVRRLTINGKAIGPYLLVVKCENNGIYGLNTTSKTKTVYYVQKKRIKRIKEIRLPLEVNTFKKVSECKQTSVYHVMTTWYKALLEKKYDVIRFYDSYGNYAYFTYDRKNVTKAYDQDSGKYYVKIRLNNLIYKE